MAFNIDNTEVVGSRVVELQQENDLLLVQLHSAQEELERTYSRDQKVEKKPPARDASNGQDANSWIAEELPDMHAENRRLQALVDAQRKVHTLESNHALNVRLGNILIEGVDSPGSLWTLPSKLLKIWRQTSRRTPPAALGGKDFGAIFSAYRVGGFEAVKKLLDELSVSSAMQANAYTALARELSKRDRANAAEAARYAYDLDPKTFRLKWLAFRLHEAGSIIEAEAMLDVLPAKTPFSESEARQARQLRAEAKTARQSEAKHKTLFAERRAAADMRLTRLTQERDQQSKLAAEHARQIEFLKQAKAKLEREKSALSTERDRIEKQLHDTESATHELAQERDRQSRLAAEHARQVEVLEQANAKLEGERSALATERSQQLRLAAEHGRQLEVLGQANAELEREKSTLSTERNQQSKLAAEHGRQLEALRHAKLKLEREVSLLATERDQTEKQLHDANAALTQMQGEDELLTRNLHQVQEQLEQLFSERERLQLANARLEEDRARESETLKQAIASLEHEKQALSVKHESQCELAQQYGRQLEDLKNERALLDREKQALSVKYEVETRIAEERIQELDVLRQAKARLEHDRQMLAVRHEMQSSVAAERVNEIEALKQAKAKLEEEKRVLAKGLEAQSKAAEERARQLESLTQAKAKLEQERQALTDGRDAQARVAQERGREIESLKQTTIKLEQEKAAVVKQRSAAAGVGSGNRGDADIDDLIGDLEVFFNGKAIIYADVGAYVGDVFMKINSSVKSFSIHEAHLFEPNPASYEQLLSKVSGIEKPIVHTYNVAVGASSDEHRFIPAKSMTKALLSTLPAESAPDDVFTVGCVGLDRQSFVFTDGKINLLKIDVEGRELDVLSSARELLTAQSVDILYIEVGFNRTGNQQAYFAEVDQFLQEFGYRVMRVYEQKEEWMKGSPLLRRANIAYMSENFANAHPLALMRELRSLKERIQELSDRR